MNNNDGILEQFLLEWPIERVKKMTLEEYTNTDKTSFCYWLESKTQNLGSIWGGSAFKFGIFKRFDLSKIETRDGYNSEEDYAWVGKYGKTKTEAFERIRSIVTNIINFSQRKEFDKILGVDLGTAYKWKIAFMYSDQRLIPIYNKKMLFQIANTLGLKVENNYYNLQKALLARKPNEVNMFDYANQLLELIDENDSSNETETIITINTPQVKSFAKSSIHPLNQILYGPPGTGKTYNSINHALAIVEGKELRAIENESDKNRKEILRRYQSYVDSGQVVFSTFHQSMSYEDFIEGIKPTEDEGQLQYDVQQGVFRLLVDEALTNYKNSNQQIGKKLFETVWLKFLTPLNEEESIDVKMKMTSYKIVHINERTIFFDKNSGESKHTLSIKTLKSMYDAGENKTIKGGLQPYYEALLKQLLVLGKESGKVELKNFVIIIDEINRGNIAQIFGELITLIETDKRFGNKEALSVTLPYSKKKDFSIPANLYIVGTMNTADRSVEALDTALRRRFTFIEMPPRYDLPELKNKIIDGLSLEVIMKILNTRIEKLLDMDHLIGHSYFLTVANLEDLKKVFHQNIIPLLQEYFYGDFAKIGLVLGEAFFEKNNESKKTVFARFAHDAADELNEKAVYRLKQTWAEGEFEKAIEEMVNP